MNSDSECDYDVVAQEPEVDKHDKLMAGFESLLNNMKNGATNVNLLNMCEAQDLFKLIQEINEESYTSTAEREMVDDIIDNSIQSYYQRYTQHKEDEDELILPSPLNFHSSYTLPPTKWTTLSFS